MNCPECNCHQTVVFLNCWKRDYTHWVGGILPFKFGVVTVLEHISQSEETKTMEQSNRCGSLFH